jgi:hypothetical protein
MRTFFIDFLLRKLGFNLKLSDKLELASRLLDGAAELHRLMRNFTTARANGDSRDNSRHDDQPLHTLHGLLS